MTDTTTPIQAMFELQRRSIEHGERLFQHGLDVQRRSVETALRNGMAANRSLQQGNVQLAQQLVEAQLDAARSTVDDETVSSAIDRQFDESEQFARDVLTAQVEQGTDLAREVYDAYLAATRSAFEAEFDVQSTMDREFEAFSEQQQETWETMEADVVDAVADLTEHQREVFLQSVEAVLSAHDDLERRTVEGVEELEAATDRAMQQVGGEATPVQFEGAAGGGDEQAPATAVEAPLEDVEGLGSTYADRLRDEGIESITHLAQADVETIAEAAETDPEQAEAWVEEAQTRA